MALSDVLQFDCYVDNDIAGNAMKDFAGMLGKAFEQYKQLWNEYLKLRKHCEEAAFNIPFQLFGSYEYNKDNYKSDTNLSQFTKKFTSLGKSVCTSCSTNSSSDFDDIIFNDEKPIEKDIEGGEILSPILTKKHPKCKRINSTTDESVCKSYKENINVPILANNLKENIVSVEPKTFQCTTGEFNDNEIKYTPIAKVQKKLGISNLYNVDTTLCRNGKKLRQSRIVPLPSEKSADTATYKKNIRASPLKSHVLPTPEKNIIRRSNNNISVGVDIIESSPNKRFKSRLKLKSLKMVKKSPIKFPENIRESNQISISQCIPHTSTHKEEPFLFKGSKTFDSCNKSTGSNCVALSSPCFVTHQDNERSCFDDTGDLTSFGETKMVESTGLITEVKRKKYLETNSQILDNTSRCSDETFYSFTEKQKENFNYEINKVLNLEEKLCDNYMLPKYLSVKQSLINSFDILPEKNETHVVKPLKNMSERAKMAGASCWECKQYYASLGLSDEDIQARQNHCSRHRTTCNKRPDTPEGFWHPLFPDTYSSTFQGD